MKLNNSTKTRKVYQLPAVVYERELISRAGPSTLPVPGVNTNDDLFK